MEKLDRDLTGNVRTLIKYTTFFEILRDRFRAAHAHALGVCTEHKEASQMKIAITPINDQQAFEVNFCDLKLRVAMKTSMSDAGVAHGLIEFFEVIPEKPFLVRADSVTFDRTGTCSVVDSDGDPAELEVSLFAMIVQVAKQVLRAKSPK